MQEYTVEEIVEIVEDLPVLPVGPELAEDPAAAHGVVDAIEGVLQIVQELPRKARYGALQAFGLPARADEAGGASTFLALANNCRLTVGLSVRPDGTADFAVRAIDGETIVEYFSARDALRHAMTGAAGIGPEDVPAPEANGAANTRRAASPKTVAAPDAAGRAFKDSHPEELLRGRDDEAPEESEAVGAETDPRARQERSTLEAEGLADPMIARSFGVGEHASFAGEVAESAETGIPDLRTVRPDWRERVSGLVMLDRSVRAADGGHAHADASRLAAASETDPALNDPRRFARELRDLGLRRAEGRLTGEDLVALSRAGRIGALAASDLMDRAERLADAGAASLRIVDGELLLVPSGVDPQDPRVRGAAEAVRLARRVDEAHARRETVRQRRERLHLLDAHARWQRVEASRSWRVGVVHRAMACLDHSRVTGVLAPCSTTFIARLGSHARAALHDTPHDLLEAYRAAYRQAAASERRREAKRGPLHPGSGPFNDAATNRKEVSRLYRRGLRGKAARLEALGAPAAEVRFWRSFELKPNGDPKGAYAAPEVPFGGTPVEPHELRWALRVEAARVRRREKVPVGLLAERLVERPPVAVRYGPHGNTVRVRAVRWTERSAVLYDPEGLYDAPEPGADRDRRLQTLLSAVSRGAVDSPAAVRSLARRLKERRSGAPTAGPDSRADRLPEAERESGPEPEGSFARRGRDPFAAERHQGQEAVIVTRTGRALVPSRTAAQRERAANRIAATMAEASEVARANSRGLGISTDARRQRALADHLAALPAADRLELFLALHGPREFAALERSASDPAGLKLAARELYDAGRMSYRDGLVSAPALTAEAKRELERALSAPAKAADAA